MNELIKVAISLVVIVYIIYFIVAFGGVVFSTISGTWDYYTYQLVTVAIMITSLLLIYNYNRRTNKAIKEAEDYRKRNDSEFRAKEQNFNRYKRELDNIVKEITEETDKLEEAYNQAMKTSNPFRHVAEMYADWETIVYENTTHFLKTKKHPAVKRSEDVRVLKEKTKETVRNYKEMKYKYLGTSANLRVIDLI
jgi:low affinity Fe/Cu permease